jgi:hypothetical protein
MRFDRYASHFVCVQFFRFFLQDRCVIISDTILGRIGSVAYCCSGLFFLMWGVEPSCRDVRDFYVVFGDIVQRDYLWKNVLSWRVPSRSPGYSF